MMAINKSLTQCRNTYESMHVDMVSIDILQHTVP